MNGRYEQHIFWSTYFRYLYFKKDMHNNCPSLAHRSMFLPMHQTTNSSHQVTLRVHVHRFVIYRSVTCLTPWSLSELAHHIRYIASAVFIRDKQKVNVQDDSGTISLDTRVIILADSRTLLEGTTDPLVLKCMSIDRRGRFIFAVETSARYWAYLCLMDTPKPVFQTRWVCPSASIGTPAFHILVTHCDILLAPA